MEIIGHVSARRVLTPKGSWLYETRENQALAMHCIFMRSAALPDLDGFIEALEVSASSEYDVKEAKELRKLRSRALQACLDSDFDSLKERILLIDANTSWKSYWEDREKFLLELAIPHALVKSGAAKGGKIRGEQQRNEKAQKSCVEMIRGRGNVADIINGLAITTDQLGGYFPAKELWPQLIGELDVLGLNPEEIVDEKKNPIRIDYTDGDGKKGDVKFSSFKVMVSQAQNAKKVK